MKALILILLVGTAAQAQTIADIARQARAKAQGTRVITNEDLKRPQLLTPETQEAPPAGEKPQTQAEPAEAAQSPATTQQQASEAAKPAEPDPVQAWNAELDQLRKQLRELQDRETATLLQINDLTNQVYAPVTSVRARNEAQAALGAAQKNLTTIREDIVTTRLRLEQLQARGPAKN